MEQVAVQTEVSESYCCVCNCFDLILILQITTWYMRFAPLLILARVSDLHHQFNYFASFIVPSETSLDTIQDSFLRNYIKEISLDKYEGRATGTKVCAVNESIPISRANKPLSIIWKKK